MLGIYFPASCQLLLFELSARLELLCSPGKESGGQLIADESLLPAGFKRVFRVRDANILLSCDQGPFPLPWLLTALVRGHLSGEFKDVHLWRALSEVDPRFALVEK